MSEVLVLNKNYIAVSLTNKRRAIQLVYLDRANVIDEEYRTYDFNDWCELSQMIESNKAGFIYSPTFKIAIPEVIVLKYYDKVQLEEPRLTRKNIYENYDYKCCYCGKKFDTTKLNIDHVIPRSRGGKTEWTNVVTSCISCNLKKGNKTPSEAGMKLTLNPHKPSRRIKFALILKTNIKIPSSWQKFIDTLYWNSELEE